MVALLCAGALAVVPTYAGVMSVRPSGVPLLAPAVSLSGLAAVPRLPTPLLAPSLAAPAARVLEGLGAQPALQRLAAADNPDPAGDLAAVFDNAAAPAAPVAAGPAISELWSVLETGLGAELGLALKPDRTRRWASLTSQLLHDDPATPLRKAMAQALARAHGLGPMEAARAETLLAGFLADAGPAGFVHRLVRTDSGFYAFTNRGVFLRRNGRWDMIMEKANFSFPLVHEKVGGTLFVSDYKEVYAFEEDRVSLVPRARQCGPPALHAGTLYLPTDAGLMVKQPGSEEWVEDLDIPGPTIIAAEAAGRLFVGTEGKLFERTATGWTVVLEGAGRHPGKIHDVIALNGKIYVTTFPLKTHLTTIYEIDGNGAPRMISTEGMGQPFAHAGRLYAPTSLMRSRPGTVEDLYWVRQLHEWKPQGWRPVLDDTADGWEHAIIGRDLYVSTDRGLHRKTGETPFRDLGAKVRWLEDAAPGPGRRYLQTSPDYGHAVLYEDAEGLLQTLLLNEPDLNRINGMVMEEGRLFLGTDEGVKELAFPGRAPLDWEDRIWEELDAETATRGRLPPSEPSYSVDQDGGVRDDEGRIIFGLGRPRRRAQRGGGSS